MSKPLVSTLRNIIPLGIGVFLIYYSLCSITADQRSQIWSTIQKAHPLPILISVVFGIMSHLSRAYRWKYQLNPLGYHPKLINLIGSVLVNYLSNLGIPRSGDVLRVTVISAYEKISFSKGVGTVISERVIDLVIMLLLVFSAIYMGGDWVKAELSESSGLLMSFYIIMVLVVAIMVFPFLINSERFPFLARIKSFFLNIYQGILSIGSVSNAYAFWAHTIFIWVMYIMMFWVIQFSLPLSATLGLEVILVGFVAGGLSIAVTNGGIGLYPLAVATVLNHYGMPYEMALAYGWIAWSTQTIMILIFGGLSFAFLPVVNRKK